jgi:hypothetical protein
VSLGCKTRPVKTVLVGQESLVQRKLFLVPTAREAQDSIKARHTRVLLQSSSSFLRGKFNASRASRPLILFDTKNHGEVSDEFAACESSPSMRRPVSVKTFLSSFLFFSLSASFISSSSKLFPFSQAASVATLPSALFGERFSLGARWVYLIQ